MYFAWCIGRLPVLDGEETKNQQKKWNQEKEGRLKYAWVGLTILCDSLRFPITMNVPDATSIG